MPALLALLVCLTSPCLEVPESIAARSGYTRTATEAEISEILTAAAARDPRMQLWTMGMSNENRPIQALKIGFDKDSGEQALFTVVIIGGIHSGECAGKEALCTLIKEISENQHADWLERMRILAVPSLSPDSNTRRAIDNRPGQVGPSEGMGQRPNAQGLDLNRDFMKLETPEIQSLVRAMNAFDADVLIDLHTTNGSQHQYELTYDPPHHPVTSSELRSFLRAKLLPYVTRQSAAANLDMFYYGNFDRSHSRWTTYGFESRYSTNYTGVRGAYGILSEAYSYADYSTRIDASLALMQHSLDFFAANIQEAISIRKSAPRVSAGTMIPLRAEVAAFDAPSTILGYRPDPDPKDAEREPVEFQVQFYGRFEPTISTELPIAYFVPATEPEVLALLERHGIEVQQSAIDEPGQLQEFVVSDARESERAFQGHKMVQVDGDWTEASAKPSDGAWVKTDQPLGVVAALLLEPQSSDSIATWNVIPFAALSPGVKFPVLRLCKQ